MSLDCFGKIVSATAQAELELCIPRHSDVRIVFGDIDPEDDATISKLGRVKESGLSFRLTSLDGMSSATGLWLAASDVANRFSENERQLLNSNYSIAIRATALGGFIWNLFNCSNIRRGALALVDGGIETIHHAGTEKCWKHFLKIIPQPWDTHDNPLYVWEKKD